MYRCLKTVLSAAILFVACVASAQARSSEDAPDVQADTAEGRSSLSHIEQKSGWYTSPDQGHPVCEGPETTSEPSVDGNSARFSLRPTGQFDNCLWPIKLGKSKTATHFTLEVQYRLSDPYVSQGVEFSSNKHVGTRWYKFSVQCSYNKGIFSVWNTAGRHWSATDIPCRRPARDSWDHLTVQTEIIDGKAVFRSLTLNDKTYEINKSFDPITKEDSYSFGVHFQMNGDKARDRYYVWVDNLKFGIW